ncbi:MAG: phosphoribosyltransferase [Actinomycetes bacterium]
MDTRVYVDRDEAGRVVADRVAGLGLADPLVLALPRGGVPVAVPVARRLGAELDVLVVRKVGLPGRPELAVGAVAAGVEVLDPVLLDRFGIGRADLADVLERERTELARRERRYRHLRPALTMTDRDVVVVDDGLATGATARVAGRLALAAGARTVVLAVPVGPPGTVVELGQVFDRVVCPSRPRSFRAVAEWYEDFDQVDDDTVLDLLAAQRTAAPARRAGVSSS